MRREMGDDASVALDLAEGIEPGTVIDDRYEIVDKIGEGGFAAVYKAEQLSTGQTVAFKLLLPQRARRSTGDVELVRFLREMQVIAEIEHPGVVRLIDSGQIDIVHDAVTDTVRKDTSSDAAATVVERRVDRSGTQRSADGTRRQVGSVPYIVMEFLHGRTLSNLFEREGRLSMEAACDLAIPVLSALGAAHDKGIIHRDIKPDNILLVADHRGREVPKVLDFGIAKITVRGVDDLTENDTFIGTPEYMSPEQGRGKKDVDERADVFSVGAVMYQAVTGKRLYRADGFLAMIHAVAAAEFDPPSALGCDLSPEFERTLLTSLSRDREDRQASVRIFARELLPYASAPIRRRYHDELLDPQRTSITVAPHDALDSVDPESETDTGTLASQSDAPTEVLQVPEAVADQLDAASPPAPDASSAELSEPEPPRAVLINRPVVVAVVVALVLALAYALVP
jgi:serine/threonine-protein kinase